MALRERVGIGCILLLEVLDIGGSHCDGWPLGSQWTGDSWGWVVFVECVEGRDDMLSTSRAPSPPYFM